MMEDDKKFMNEAITWANGCKPKEPAIPKVGAIIVTGGKAIGRGRRGTGQEGDDQHAEWHAIEAVEDKSLLPQATLFTTLEPCTPEVRSKPLECCTHLILQHKIKRVVIGILDPNQGVTGKGLWRLQNENVEVELFPHELAQQIRSINADFIRTQQTFGVTILSPANGSVLETFKTEGKHAVRFKSLNPPTDDNYLLSFNNGLCWPQPGPFRQVEGNVWEIDAYFGSPGDHTLQLVTSTDLGNVLIGYYRKIVLLNVARRKRLTSMFSNEVAKQLWGGYPGIDMNGLPKGIRLEASVSVTIAKPPF
jgi:pyrimidine deaminase RibD-like protein